MNRKLFKIIMAISLLFIACDPPKRILFNHNKVEDQFSCQGKSGKVSFKKGLSASDYILVTIPENDKIELKSFSYNGKEMPMDIQQEKTVFLISAKNLKFSPGDELRIIFLYNGCSIDRKYVLEKNVSIRN